MNEIFNNIKKADTYKECVVAFVDILGYSQKIKDSKKPSDILYLNVLCKYFEERTIKEDFFKTYFFSDCMYIFSDIEHAINVVEFISTLSFVVLLNSPIMIDVTRDAKQQNVDVNYFRGGLTIGKAYYDNDFFVGPAVIEAYSMEQKTAKYPRIIVSSVFYQKVDEGTKKLICEDIVDGEKYIDFLNGKLDNSNSSTINDIVVFLEKKKHQLEQQSIESTMTDLSSPSVKEKIQWVIDYIKNSLSKFEDIV